MGLKELWYDLKYRKAKRMAREDAYSLEPKKPRSKQTRLTRKPRNKPQNLLGGATAWFERRGEAAAKNLPQATAIHLSSLDPYKKKLKKKKKEKTIASSGVTINIRIMQPKKGKGNKK